MNPAHVVLLIAALIAGLAAAWALRRPPERRRASRLAAYRSALRDIAAALDDDPARDTAADALGVAREDIEWNPLTRVWALTPEARERGVRCSLHMPQPPSAVPALPLRIYVASSWRNTHQPAVVESLTRAGYEVYDFRNPPKGAGFAWGRIDPQWEAWAVAEFRAHLDHPDAIAGYEADLGALEEADACVLVLPCGRSAHLEAGWAAGNGTPLIIHAPEPTEPELMYRMADALCENLDELLAALRKLDDRRCLAHRPCPLPLDTYCRSCRRPSCPHGASPTAQSVCQRGGAG